MTCDYIAFYNYHKRLNIVHKGWKFSNQWLMPILPMCHWLYFYHTG